MLSNGSSKTLIRDLPNIKKPRERLIHFGANNLTNIELLAILLSSGTKQYSVLNVAKKLLKRFPLEILNKTSLSELISISGIGYAKACTILACLELSNRIHSNRQLMKLNNPQKIFELARDIKDKKKEYTLALYLNGRQELTHKQIISIGSLNYNLLEVRDVFTPALTLPASFVILVHNHPSGDPTASDDDIKVTKKLLKAGEILGINMIDHVIVSFNNYFSFKEENLI